MVNDKREYTKKFRVNERELKMIRKNFLKSGGKSESDFMRSRALYTDRQLAKQDKLAKQMDAITREGQFNALNEMTLLLNQCKAGISVEVALPALEKEMTKLCQLLK